MAHKKQHTLASVVSFSAIQRHKHDPELRIHPASENHGLRFQRLDLDAHPVVSARLASLRLSADRLDLVTDGVEIRGIERILATLVALRVDNALVTLTGPQVPEVEGGAAALSEAILKVGRTEQRVSRRLLRIQKPIAYKAENDAQITAIPAEHESINVEIDDQRGSNRYVSHGDLEQNVATFRQFETDSPALFGIMAVLALLGRTLMAEIKAISPESATVAGFGKKLSRIFKNIPDVPTYQLGDPLVLDLEQVKKILPHAPPFLFLDGVFYQDSEYTCGFRHFSMSDAFFQGHFPGKPIVPGVIQLEALMQLGILHYFAQIERGDVLGYVTSIENARFKRMVVAGETISFSVRYVEEPRFGLMVMSGKGYVNDELAFEATFQSITAPDTR